VIIHHRAAGSPRAWAVLVLVLGVGLTADLWTKAWAFRTIAGVPVEIKREEVLRDPNWHPPTDGPVHALPWNLLDYRLVINRGAVFGIGENQRAFFILFTVFALGAGLLVFGRLTDAKNHLAHAAIGLVLAGGVGNLYDRIQYGVVRDFLHMLPDRHLPFGWRWPGNNPEIFPWVFNIADVMLLAGIGLLFIQLNRPRKPGVVAQAATGTADQQTPALEKAATAQPAGRDVHRAG